MPFEQWHVRHVKHVTNANFALTAAPCSAQLHKDPAFMDEQDDPAFEAASAFVAAHVSDIDDDSKLKLYGLYKQATTGPCTATKPSFFDFKGRAKWSV